MDEYKYSVVEFIQRPHPDIAKFVCVPSSWITTRRETDTKVGVLYPNEDKETIEKLVKKNRKIKPSMDFKEFLCELLYNTNEYSSARIFIMMKNTKGSEKGCRSSLCSGSAHKVKETPTKNCLKRPHSPCSKKNAHSQTAANSSMNYKSIIFLKEIGALTAKLAEVINSYAASFDNCTPEDMGTSQMQEEENDDTGDETENPRKKRTLSFDLPPEYEQNDSKWTLKYREPGQHLIELMPDSEVYIKDCDLGHCLKYAQNQSQLTRSLLLAIFNENALKTCSITGSKAYGHKIEDKRPGLDRVAKDAMLKFVHMYGETSGWERIAETALNVCIRNKLNEIRKKTPQKTNVLKSF